MGADRTTPKISLSWMALLRIMIGLMFLTTWYSNLEKGYYTSNGLMVFFSDVFPLSQNPLTFYTAFIEGVIIPYRQLFAPFQMVSELLLGIALLLGFFTPLFSLGGIFFLINTFLLTIGQDWPWAYLMPISILGTCTLTQAGRALGVDGLLLRRYGRPSLPIR